MVVYFPLGTSGKLKAEGRGMMLHQCETDKIKKYHGLIVYVFKRTREWTLLTQQKLATVRKTIKRFLVTPLSWSQPMYIKASFFLFSLFSYVSSISVFVFLYYSHHISPGYWLHWIILYLFIIISLTEVWSSWRS